MYTARWHQFLTYFKKLPSDKNKTDEQEGGLHSPTKRLGFFVAKILVLRAIPAGLNMGDSQEKFLCSLREGRHTKHPVLFNSLHDIYPRT